ncbi:MAG: uracil-DNA glycosylase, partial [Gammaproteobacteria bacterium]
MSDKRLQYLEAMGIEVWTLRQRPVDESDAQFAANTNIGEDENLPMFETDFVREQDEAQTQAVNPPVVEADPIPATESAWTELQAEVAACRRCSLCETRTQTVFGTGNDRADWMVIGEAPGQSEDEQGKPFVGRAGQ